MTLPSACEPSWQERHFIEPSLSDFGSTVPFTVLTGVHTNAPFAGRFRFQSAVVAVFAPCGVWQNTQTCVVLEPADRLCSEFTTSASARAGIIAAIATSAFRKLRITLCSSEGT